MKILSISQRVRKSFPSCGPETRNGVCRPAEHHHIRKELKLGQIVRGICATRRPIRHSGRSEELRHPRSVQIFMMKISDCLRHSQILRSPHEDPHSAHHLRGGRKFYLKFKFEMFLARQGCSWPSTWTSDTREHSEQGWAFSNFD